MSRKIPNFKYPTIAEVLCEIHFKTANSQGLKSTDYNILSDILKTDFPSPKEQELQGFEAIVGPSGLSVKPVGTPTKKKIFTHNNRPHLIQVSPNTITINELNTYPGWDVFEPDIHMAVNALCAAVKIEKITRIGLRYINQIPRQADDKVGSWLKETAYYPDGILKSAHKFASRFEFRHDSELRAIVTISEGQDSKGSQPILFDIDCIFENVLSTDKDALSAALDRVHQLSWEVFGSSLTDKYKSYLDKGTL